MRRIECESPWIIPRYVIQPEVGGAGLWISAVGDKTLFVWGEPNIVKTCFHIQRVDWLTATIHPAVLTTLPLMARIEDQHAVVRDGKGVVIEGNNITPNLV